MVDISKTNDSPEKSSLRSILQHSLDGFNNKKAKIGVQDAEFAINFHHLWNLGKSLHLSTPRLGNAQQLGHINPLKSFLSGPVKATSGGIQNWKIYSRLTKICSSLWLCMAWEWCYNYSNGPWEKKVSPLLSIPSFPFWCTECYARCGV